MIRPIDLISPRYVDLQKELHASPRGYGGRGRKWADVVAGLMERFDAVSVLDYGCGQGSLAVALWDLGIICREYDPAIPGKDGMPSFADLVVCTDVLEHVEPNYLPTVLRHLRLLARKAVFLVVSTVDTAKVLSDGRNAHVIIQPAGWWHDQVTVAGFDVLPAPDSARKKPDKEWVAVLLP